MGPGMFPGGYSQVGGYLNNFNMQNLENELQLAIMEQQLAQQQNLFGMGGMPPGVAGMPGALDQFGQMGAPMPVGGTTPLSGINPLSQMGGLLPPNQALQGGGVTEGLQDVSGTGTPPWPKGTQQTAGGYFIMPGSVAHADQPYQGFTIYKPNSKGPDKDNILFSSWGSPHVEDKGGNIIFSFSKNSDFQLPDGTTLAVGTRGLDPLGSTTVNSLDIINGNSRVNVSYSRSASDYTATHNIDGINWLANRYASSNWSHDTYNLALDSKGNPTFYDFVNGQDTGKVTGSIFSSTTGSVPKVDSSQTNYAVDMQFRPPPGSPAYGNMLWQQALQIYEDPKYRDNLPVEQLAAMTAQWENNLSASQAPIGGNAPSIAPMYQGSQFGGGVNPAMMQYLQYMYQMMSQYPPMQAGAYYARY